jgi:hypothetical protein
MSLARLVVTAVRVEGRSKSAVAREYRVSRRWVHELVRRYDAQGDAGLAPRSAARIAVLPGLRPGWRRRSSAGASGCPSRAWTPARPP